MAENIYNKTISNAKGLGVSYQNGGVAGVSRGTLVGNWYEERALRTFTGVGRSIVREHIPKKHLNFEEPIRAPKKFDDTHDRILGEKKVEIMSAESFHYGTGVNKADALPKVGLKNKRMEQEMRSMIAGELNERDDVIERQKEIRCFETTTKDNFHQKSLTENTIGRWVMKTQDGN